MTSWLKLANKTAIVTGAGSGIGAAVALALSQQKCRLVLADVAAEKLQGVANQCQSEAIPVVTDVTRPDQVRSLIEQADEFAAKNRNNESCSILVNCAGITRDSFISKMTLQQWDDVLDVNLRGTFLMCQAFCDESRSISTGSIVNVGSIVSEQGNMGQVNYAASKGGVLGLTRSLAKEMASRTNIRANAVLPGFIDTEMSRAVPERVRAQIVQRIALKRFGQAEDVANLVLFLASCERSGYITGECMTCSGMISM